MSRELPGIDRASERVAVGNRKVFAEIGREFARFLNGHGASMQAFIDGFRSGPPPEGQELLRRAFANYQAARAAVDGTARAQLLLLANVQIGLHEQTRLQPEIREALDAALLDVSDTRRRILERVDKVFEAGPLGRVRTDARRQTHPSDPERSTGRFCCSASISSPISSEGTRRTRASLSHRSTPLSCGPS